MLKLSTTRKALVVITPLVVLAAGATIAKPPSEFTVHEWGTFLAMNGSDGVTLDGMYHEEHALPTFVHSRSKDQLRVPAVSVKGETPVIYFYTDRERSVDVHVRFPRGLWTQWYPQAEFNGPSTAQAGSPPELKNGHITWRVKISPPSPGIERSLPKTDPGALWRFARDVDAAYVRPDGNTALAPRELERFIFYRGLGEATLPLQLSASGNGTLSYEQSDLPPIRHLFTIRVEHGRAAYRYIPALRAGQTISEVIPSMKSALLRSEFVGRISDDLANRLTESGLYAREARAMVNTWQNSYFESDGLRVLFIMPQEWTDRFIPMEISPTPAHRVRVMVGRLEALTPEREQAAEESVRNLSSSDSIVRDRAYEFFRGQGRYLEPVLRRTLKTSSDPNVQQLCTRLLMTDFVTELRVALNTQGGEDRQLNELDARAQLASLLREVGLKSQAAEEARRIAPEVARLETPGIHSPAYRPYARIHARTMEGLGDDAGAAHWYSQFVKFGSQTATCGGCHSAQGPSGMAWYRDWWAGKKYAYYATRVETADKAIARSQAALKLDPNDTAARMELAYLCDQAGDTAQSARLWTRLERPASGSTPELAHQRAR